MGSLRKAEPDNLDGPGAAGLSAKHTDRGKGHLGLISFCVWKKSHLMWKTNYRAKNFISIFKTLAQNLTLFIFSVYSLYIFERLGRNR